MRATNLFRPLYTVKRKRRERRLAEAMAELAELKKEKDKIFGEGVMIALGNVAQSWAALEILLDVNNWCISQAMTDRERFPVSLSRKLRFFTRGHSSIECLQQLAPEAVALANDIRTLSAKRHNVIHGCAWGAVSGDVIELQVHKVPLEAARHHLYEQHAVPYTHDEIWRVAREAGALAQRSLQHVREIGAAIEGTKKVEKLGG